MKRTPPVQKPGRSEQSVGTPHELVNAACRFLEIPNFSIDLAAEKKNRVTKTFVSKDQNSLRLPWNAINPEQFGWGWLNPPYSTIAPWVQKAKEESFYYGMNTAVLIPASTGANWWRDYVDRQARILLLNGRVTFVGHNTPYPKDLALLLYGNVMEHPPGYEVWQWKLQG